jgi:hypothetical protein
MHLHAKSTALVLIDLQKGVLAMPVVPYSGATILARSTKLASGFRATGSPVVWVRVFFASSSADAPRAQVDLPTDHSVLPSGWYEFPHPLDPADVMVTKRQGAPSTAPISMCSYGAAACAPLCWAASPPALAWSPPRAAPMNTATSSSSARICAPISSPRCTPPASSTSSHG